MSLHLARIPRLRFAHLPTPLEPLKNLSRVLNGPEIWMKRDDCTGLAGGGNKTRKLEFIMAAAQLEKADTIITQGATQSNHVRQTSAIAAKLGMDCHIFLEDRVGSTDKEFHHNGNVFLNQIFNATLYPLADGNDMNQAMNNLATSFQGEGKRPYIIPGGGSTPLGAIGYVDCAREMVAQADSMGLEIDHLVTATGSGGTHAGLLAGLSHYRIPIVGISVRQPRPIQEALVYKLASEVCDYLGISGQVKSEDVVAYDEYVGAGYGQTTPEMKEAIELVARTESILLDPVYSGKGMAGFIDLIKKGKFKKNEKVVFLHTGGMHSLFGYRQEFTYDDYEKNTAI